MNESMARRGKMAGKQGTGGPRRTVGGRHWRKTKTCWAKTFSAAYFKWFSLSVLLF